MKKITGFLIIIISIASFGLNGPNLLAQAKVNFKVTNPVVNGNIFSLDVVATIPSGQQWKAGPTCIRVNYSSLPPGALTVLEDTPATNANLNVSNNSNYGPMTTTEIMSDSAISLNILQLFGQQCYTFTSGNSYVLGSIRFNIINNNACINAAVMPISAVFDSLTPLVYNTGWTKTDSLCSPIGINIHQISKIPTQYKLYQNYPNPFNPVTRIRYEIPKAGDVKLEIFDELGRMVETVVDRNQQAGVYEVNWNASEYASGLYLFRLTAGSYVQTNKMVLIK